MTPESMMTTGSNPDGIGTIPRPTAACVPPARPERCRRPRRRPLPARRVVFGVDGRVVGGVRTRRRLSLGFEAEQVGDAGQHLEPEAIAEAGVGGELSRCTLAAAVCAGRRDAVLQAYALMCAATSL